MRAFGLKFRVLSPLLFRGPGEFSPQARGPVAHATSLALPPPSTLAGCLATLMGKYQNAGGGDWEQEVVGALGLGQGSFLRGPYLLAGGKMYVQVGSDEVLEVSSISHYISSVSEGKRGIDEIKKELRRQGELKPIRTRTRVGVRLTEEKSVDEEEGGLYLADFRDYQASFGEENMWIGDVWIGMDAHDFEASAEGIVRLGGEGKIARVEREERARLWEFVEEFLGRPPAECWLLLVSPSFIEAPRDEVEKVEDGCYIYPAFYSSARKLLPAGIRLKRMIGSAELLGAGFSLARGIRKPAYVALAPGTLLQVEIDKPEVLRQVYQRGLTVKGGRIGYGSFIPVVHDRK